MEWNGTAGKLLVVRRIHKDGAFVGQREHRDFEMLKIGVRYGLC